MNTQDTATGWRDVLGYPAGGDHIVQVYEDERFLSEALGEYIDAGLRTGDGAMIIATPEHRALFSTCIPGASIAQSAGQLRILDAEETLASFMQDGMPDWTAFRRVVGGAVAELRLQYPAVRLYGEMVDVLWQRGEREAAIRLEEFWNELARLQTFSLFCAYRMDPLDPGCYGGPLEAVCKVHTHLIPARDYARLNDAVLQASAQVLEQPLQNMLLSLASHHRSSTQMPIGQTVLLWLKANMPRTAERVLAEVKTRC